MNDLTVFGTAAIVFLTVGATIRGNKISDPVERRILRKWCAICAVGVFALIFVPGLLAHLEIIPGTRLAIFPCLFVILLFMAYGQFYREITAAKARGDNSGE